MFRKPWSIICAIKLSQLEFIESYLHYFLDICFTGSSYYFWRPLSSKFGENKAKMGNILEQYWLVVGCAWCWLDCQAVSRMFQGKILVFYVLFFCFAPFYIPVLKHVISILIPELIRLAKDVETNPGPVAASFDVSKTICAPYSQSSILFGENQGSQCVANSLSFHCLSTPSTP